jgi:transcription antitermination factor NusG
VCKQVNSNAFVSRFPFETETSTGLEWFAIQVKCRYEERIASVLLDKGFETLAATLKVKTADAGCGKSRALFPGYIFGRFDALYRMPILVTPGVQAIAGFGKRPSPVDANEIAAIRKVLESGEPVEPCTYLEAGDLVEITRGPLTGMRGLLFQQRSSYRIVLSVSLIQRSIKVEVPQNAVMPLRRRPQTVMANHSRSSPAALSSVS